MPSVLFSVNTTPLPTSATKILPEFRATHEPVPTEDSKSLAMMIHLVPLLALVLSVGFLGFVTSLAMWIMFKGRSPFVRSHAAMALNVQIMTGVYLLISAALMLVGIGFVTYPLVIVFACVFHAIGALRAREGKLYFAPFTPRFFR